MANKPRAIARSFQPRKRENTKNGVEGEALLRIIVACVRFSPTVTYYSTFRFVVAAFITKARSQDGETRRSLEEMP
jgi:hypothetical protein